MGGKGGGEASRQMVRQCVSVWHVCRVCLGWLELTKLAAFAHLELRELVGEALDTAARYPRGLSVTRGTLP